MNAVPDRSIAVLLWELEETTREQSSLAAKRDRLIRSLRDAGFSTEQIARSAGLTRQRVWQILKAE